MAGCSYGSRNEQLAKPPVTADTEGGGAARLGRNSITRCPTLAFGLGANISCIPGGTKGKTGMAVKMLIFSTVGWGLPFFAWKYSEYKVNNN